MAHMINRSAIGTGAKLWLQAYDEKDYAMKLYHVRVDEVAEEAALFQNLDEGALICEWAEDYNYRFGWRCWDERPSEEDLAATAFAS